MHRDFRKRLDEAKGVSEFVIAVNLDIRGFSKWSLEVDSAQTVLFIKKVYARLIDRYFADAAFFKPTGDGLLVILSFEEDRVGETVKRVVSDAMKIVTEFDGLCADEPVVNFAVPPYLGVGISRGAASRLVSGKYTLDYSGRVLNLASRLMDLARPKGVVFDSRLGVDLLSPGMKSKFASHEVYLPGVAARTPVEVQCWPPGIEIPAVNLSPIGKPKWEHVEHEAPRKKYEGVEHFALDLPSHPPDPTTLRCDVVHDQPTQSGRRSTSYTQTFEIPVEYVDAAGQPEAQFRVEDLEKELDAAEVKPNWPVRVRMSYRIS
jgi:class 3 adenylate cyclase